MGREFVAEIKVSQRGALLGVHSDKRLLITALLISTGFDNIKITTVEKHPLVSCVTISG